MCDRADCDGVHYRPENRDPASYRFESDRPGNDGRCVHGRMWGDRTDVMGRNGVPLCADCGTVHVISATALVKGPGDVYLAMCGEELGLWTTATSRGHIVGNYAQTNDILRRSTCEGCVSAVKRSRGVR